MRFINLSFLSKLIIAITGSIALASAAFADSQLAVNKVKGPLSVMVLGSGGPVAYSAGRASAGYLIFVDGQPKILMDAGGGTYQRVAASGTNIKDLDIVLLSHLHIDHTSDLSAIIKTAYFHNRGYNLAHNAFPPGRTAPFRIFGPGENGKTFPAVLKAKKNTTQYPATSEYIDAHYDLNHGVERYLNVFSRAISGGIFKYEVTDVDPQWASYTPHTLIDEDGLTIKAVGVHHGPVPALGYRIEYKGKSIVFSGDTNSQGDNMIGLAQDADLLIYDTAIMDDQPSGPNDGVFFALHTPPTRLGEVAAAAKPEHLLLSHITPVTDPNLDQVKRIIHQQGYRGHVSAAHDLQVINLFDGEDDHRHGHHDGANQDHAHH
jgi:ribonuclease BN (tRNA processing enzyme)